MRLLDPDRLGEHLDRLYRAAWALCGSAEAAEDLVQETLTRVLARPRILRGDDELAYLVRALRNTYFSERRSLRRRPEPEPLDRVAEPADGRVSAEPHAAAETRLVYGAISALSDEFKAVLVAVDVAGLSYAEAARALGVPEGTVMSRLFRARRQVADALEPERPARLSRESARRPSRTRA